MIEEKKNIVTKMWPKVITFWYQDFVKTAPFEILTDRKMQKYLLLFRRFGDVFEHRQGGQGAGVA